MSTGPPIQFADAIQPSQCRQSDSYSVSMRYRDQPSKDAYGPVSKRGTELEIDRPAPDIETLRLQVHLEAQLHAANRGQWDESVSIPNDGSLLYDIKILEVADDALRVEGISPDTLGIPNRRLKAIVLTGARGFSNAHARLTYLNNSPRTCVELGYDGVDVLPSYETLKSELETRLPNELDGGLESLQRACIQAVHAVYRNGIVPPSKITSLYGFDALDPPFDERRLPRWVEQQVIRNWVQFLTEKTLDPLTFGRKAPRLSMFQFLGVFAASALDGSGFQSVPDTSDWHLERPQIPLAADQPKNVDLDRSAIPKGSGIPKYIDRLPLRDEGVAASQTETPSIVSQFDRVHYNTLSVAQDLGFFRDGSLSLASDIFRIEWNGSDKAPTIDRPTKDENDVWSEWTFAVVSIVENEARFTIGMRWLPRKSTYPNRLKEILPITIDFFGINAIYADSEMVSGDLINALRKHAGPDFIIRAPDQNRLKALKALTPENHVGFVQNVSWNCQPKPNLVAYPKGSSDPSLVTFTPRQISAVANSEWPGESERPGDSHSLSEFTESGDSFPTELRSDLGALLDKPKVGTVSSHNAYLTGRTLPERSTAGVHFRYYQRWAVEENINQISNDFMPRINSANPKLRTYGVNVSILFQNWHTLINRTPSPKLGYRLDITHQQLLTAIKNMAFEH